MLTKASNYKQERFCFFFNIIQEWSRVVGQIQITQAPLITDSKETNFYLGSENRRIEDLKKDEG